jgi:hypothetical protein
MSIDDEFEIEVGINKLRRKDLMGSHIRENRNWWEPKQLFVYLRVFIMC